MSKDPAAALWSEQWMEAQRAYWEAWAALSRTGAAPQTPNSTADPWSAAVENWWKSVSGGLSGDSSQFFRRVIEQSKAFFAMGQQMTQFFRAVTDGSSMPAQWQEALRDRFDAMKASVSMAQPKEWTDGLKGIMAFYELPLDTYRRTMSGATALPGDFLQNVRSGIWEGVGEHVHESVDKFLSVPGLGYTREGQEQLQQMARLMLDYQKAMQDYLDAHGRLATDTLDRFYKNIVALTQQGQTITTLRQVYDLWVDCSEEAYSKFAMSPKFREIYSRMVNALMRVKQHARLLVDEALGAFNMPTRREMNTVLKRQQELRREIRALQMDGKGGPDSPRGERRHEANTREIEALRNELSGLREQLAASQAIVAERSSQAAVDSAAGKKDQLSAAVSKSKAAKSSARLGRGKVRREHRPAKTLRSRTTAAWDISSITGGGGQPERAPRRRMPGIRRRNTPQS